jgi:PIG-X / PBN1
VVASSPNFTASFPPPNGLHPTFSLSFPSTPTPPNDNEDCALHAYITLPSTVFLDKYPFSDPLFLESHNLRALRGLSGETDLEAPEWVVNSWGSAALFELNVPTSGNLDKSFNVTIPMHTRYLPPQDASHVLLPIPFPAVFWACPSDNSGGKFAVSPFDRTALGYDAMFGGNTLFYHVPPATYNSATGGKAVASLKVPVLDTGKAQYVGAGTVGVVVLGMLWIVWSLWRGVWSKGSTGPTKASSKSDTSKPAGKTRKNAGRKEE